jgi:hypothetical protein
MGHAGRNRVDRLTRKNRRDSSRSHRMAPIQMGTRAGDAGGGRYRGVYGHPPEFDHEQLLDSLDEAFGWQAVTGAESLCGRKR